MASLKLNYEPASFHSSNRMTNRYRSGSLTVFQPEAIESNCRQDDEGSESSIVKKTDENSAFAEIIPIKPDTTTEEPFIPVLEDESLVKETPVTPAMNLSEVFITKLDSYETGIIKIREQADKGKVLLDDLLFYLDSFIKISEVLKEHETRKERDPNAATASFKTNKDTIDEVLELLQTPAFQGILRQVLVSVFIKK